MAEPASVQLFDLGPDDVGGAMRVARAYKREGNLSGDIVKVLVKMQSNPTALIRRLAALGVDRPERGAQ